MNQGKKKKKKNKNKNKIKKRKIPKKKQIGNKKEN